MIIEFIGLPASGKTFITQQIYNDCSGFETELLYPLRNFYAKSWFIRNIYKIFFVTTYIVRAPIISFQILKIIIGAEQNGRIDLIRLYLNYIFILFLYSKYRKSKKIILFEEGIFHTIWSIDLMAKNSLKESNISCLIYKDLIPDILINLKTEDKLIIERLNKRKQRARIEKSSDLINTIKKANEEINFIVNCASKLIRNKSIKIIEIYNNKESDVDTAIKNIKSYCTN